MTIRIRQLEKETWILPVKVTPKSGKDILLPLNPMDMEIRLKVAAPPNQGAANRAVIALLSKSLGIPKSRIRIIHGETSRQKQVAFQVSWSPDEWRHQLAQALSAPPEWFEVPS